MKHIVLIIHKKGKADLVKKLFHKRLYQIWRRKSIGGNYGRKENNICILY